MSDTNFLNQIDIVIVISFFAACILLSIFTAKKIENIREYALGKGQYSQLLMVGTVFATSISSYSTIGTIEKIIGLGFFFVLSFITKPVFFFLTGLILSKGAAKFKDCISVADVIEKMYGRVPGIISAISTLIMSMGMISIQIFAISVILKFVGFNESWHLVLSSLVFILYSSLGGVWAVSVTDLFQFFIFFTALPIACIHCLFDVHGLDGIYAALGNNYFSLNMSSKEWMTFLSIVIFNSIPGMAPPIIQRSLMINNKENTITIFKICGLLTIPLFSMIALLGLSAKAQGLDASSNGALEILLNGLPHGIKGIVLAGLFAIVMSTADAYLNTAGIAFTRNILKKINSSFESLKTLRISTLLLGIIAIPVAASDINIVDLFLAVSNFWTPVILVPMIIGYYNLVPTCQLIFMLSLIGGCLFTILGFLYVGSLGAITTVLGVIGSALTVFVYIYITSRQRLSLGPNFNIKSWFFICDDKYIVFALWSLLFHILGCVTLFDGCLIYFFVAGTSLAVVMLLLEHLTKNQSWLNILRAVCWHVGWALIISICVLAAFMIEVDLTILMLYVVSSLIICYVLSNFSSLLVQIVLLLGLISYLKPKAIILTGGASGSYFMKGSILLSILTIAISWRILNNKNRQLEKELKIQGEISDKYYKAASKVKHDTDVEEMLNIKSVAEKRFVANMYSALEEIEKNNLLKMGASTGRMLPIRLPPKKVVHEICINTLCIELKKFISFDVSRSKIEFKATSSVDKINLNICEHFFYQVLYSIVYNMIYLVSSGARVEVSFDLIDGEFCVALTYTGISFSKDDLVKFTRGRKFVNAFILTFNDIFNCVKDIGGSYTIDKTADGGVVRINKFIANNVVRL